MAVALFARVTLTPPLLECLDALHRLQQETPGVTATRVARKLDVDVATARERLLALVGLGLLRGDGAERVELTDAGRRLALRLLRRHRLLERFLADTLKLPWEQVHAHAQRLTPVCADEVADALAVFLGAPAQCPHGNPIPAADGSVSVERAIPLSRVPAGRGARIVRIEREEPEALKELAALGLLPQTDVHVEEVALFGGPLLIRVGASRYAIGRKIAARILVAEA